MESKLIVVLIISAILVHFVATDFTYTNGNKLKLLTKDNYYDIIHHNFKDYSAFHYAKNIVTGLFILPFIFNLHAISKIQQKFFLIIPLLVIIRSLFTSVTIFPATRENGPNDTASKDISFFDYFFGDNYDRMFSGHICFAVTASFLVFNLGIFSTNTLNLTLIGLINLIHAFIIVVTRSHYTIDVLNSGIITYLLLNQTF